MIAPERRAIARRPASDWSDDGFGEEYLAVYEPRDQEEVVEREITTGGRYVRNKMITIGDPPRTVVERVRLFEPGELVALCTEAGFRVVTSFGDYIGAPRTDDSPRAILFARRP